MNELHLFTVKRAKKMLTITPCILFLFHTIFGMVGLNANLFDMNNNTKYPLATIIYRKNCIKYGPLFICLNVINAIIAVVCLYNASYSIYDFIYSLQLFDINKKETDLNKRKNVENNSQEIHYNKKQLALIIFWEVLILIACGSAVFLFEKSINIALALSGGICAVFLCYVLPCVGYIRVTSGDKKVRLALVYCVTIVLGIIGIGVTGFELYKIIFHF